MDVYQFIHELAAVTGVLFSGNFQDFMVMLFHMYFVFLNIVMYTISEISNF